MKMETYATVFHVPRRTPVDVGWAVAAGPPSAARPPHGAAWVARGLRWMLVGRVGRCPVQGYLAAGTKQMAHL